MLQIPRNLTVFKIQGYDISCNQPVLAAGLAGRILEMYQYSVLKPPGRLRFTVASYKIIIVNI